MSLNLKVLLLLPAFGAMLHAQPMEQRADHALAFARAQLLASLGDLGDTLLYPRSTLADGRWRLVEPSDWTSGFFPGLLWSMYEYSGETVFLDAARRWTEGLQEQKLNRTTHDLGFMLFCSYGHGYRLLLDEGYRRTLLEASQTLASRYNPHVGAIKSWDWSSQWECPVIIDNMMNLELLFWAARNGGGDRLREIAVAHAETTIKNHLRDDGSTVHVVDFDSSSGAVRSRTTHQGASPHSTWARGQAWALYGFALCYRETQDRRFLEVGRRVADYFVGHLPEDAVPFWDFSSEEIPRTERDASAAAIAASGLLELARLIPDSGAVYRSWAERILSSLSSPQYLTAGAPSRGILAHAVGDRTRGIEVDVSLIYGDYYFVEALLRFRSTKVDAGARGGEAPRR